MAIIYTVSLYDDIDTLVAFRSKAKASKYLEQQMEELFKEEELDEETQKRIHKEFKTNHNKEGFNFETDDGYSHFGCIRAIHYINR